MTILLITRPNYEKTTYYLFHWNKEILQEAKNKEIKIIDLSESRANRKEFQSVIAKMNPQLVILNGHGSSDQITGQNGEVLIKVGDNEGVLKGKIVYALSCKTSQALGPASVKKGCISYIGYSEDFTFWFKNPRPLDDKWAPLFLEPSNYIPIGLIKGHSVKEVFEKAKSLYLKNIQMLIATKSLDSFLIPDLLWNMNNLHVDGSQEAFL